jgi:hypothetical protein
MLTNDELNALRAAAEAATPGPWVAVNNTIAAEHPRHEMIATASMAPHSKEADINAAYIAAASPDVLLALLERLEVAERERDEARESLDLVVAERDALMAGWKLIRVRNLKAERDVLAALLRDARGAIDIAGYGSQMAPEVRSVIERIEAALTAKEQSK